LLTGALGQCTSAAIGGSAGAYKHSIAPLIGGLEPGRLMPTFTAVQRLGKTLVKRRLASCFVDSLTLSFKKGAFVTGQANIKATGKYTDNLTRDTITAKDNVTTLTLTARVNGSTAGERLDNIHRIKAEFPAASGIWVDVAFSAVTAGSAGPPVVPSAVTITSLGGAGTNDVTYKALYADLEPGNDWRTQPAQVLETPLQVSQAVVKFGGKWDDTAKTYAGGHQHAFDLDNLDWTYNNNGTVDFTPGGGTPYYANRIDRSADPTQKLSVGRELWDWAIQERVNLMEPFTVYTLSEGAIMSGETAVQYTVEMIWPNVVAMNSPISVSGARLSETPELQVLWDATAGSVQAFVKNKQISYLQAA
jgi:hypothetical protein